LLPIVCNEIKGNNYRNKTDYTISYDKDKNEVQIGFVVKPGKDYMSVENQIDIPIINPIVYGISQTIKQIIQNNLSRFQIYN